MTALDAAVMYSSTPQAFLRQKLCELPPVTFYHPHFENGKLHFLTLAQKTSDTTEGALNHTLLSKGSIGQTML